MSSTEQTIPFATMKAVNAEADPKGSILQRLYDSEINASISSFIWQGFTAKIGDDMNGFDADACFDTYAEAEAWLATKASELYPNSLFATGKRPEGYAVGSDGAGIRGSTSLDGSSTAA